VVDNLLLFEFALSQPIPTLSELGFGNGSILSYLNPSFLKIWHFDSEFRDDSGIAHGSGLVGRFGGGG
jgi:hypothetical protein